MPNPRKQDRQLDELYQQLPTLRCQGLCTDSCGPIDASVRERVRLIETARRPLTTNHRAQCSMLTPAGLCSAYEVRPMICRLYGMVDAMRCPHGCTPEGGLLTNEQAAWFLDQADRIGGAPPGTRTQRAQRTIAQAFGQMDAVNRLKFIRETGGRQHG